MTKRVLAATRISVLTDESTSIERQDLAIAKAIEGIPDGVLVGKAQDLNTSASKVDPFSREELGHWLIHRHDEIDVIVWWRMDRAVRSMVDLSALIKWAKEYKKCLLFAEGAAARMEFDFSGTVKKDSLAELLAMIIAWAAEVESENISQRVTSSHSYLRGRGEWGGGMVPYGYVPLRIPDADRGWKLVKCDETYQVLAEVIEKVLSQDSLLSITKDLNERGIDSPRDWWQKYKGRAKKGHEWNTTSLKKILTSRTLLGESVYEGQQVVDSDGIPVARGNPLITESKFQEIQSALALRAMQPKTKYDDPNPLLGVAFCARCGEPFYMKQETQKGRVYTSLSCRSRHGSGRSCGQSTISMRYATEVIDQLFMALVGSQEEKIRRFIPGDDKSEQLVEWKKRIDVLKFEWDSLLLSDQSEYISRLRLYQGKIDEIGLNPVRPSRYEFISTGRTYDQIWPGLDMERRRTKLINMGVRVFLGRGETPAVNIMNRVRADSQHDEFRQQHHLTAVDVTRALADVSDGRVKKDFHLTWTQTGEAFAHELVDTKG